MHLVRSGKYYYWSKEDDFIPYLMKDIIKKIWCSIPCEEIREQYILHDHINYMPT